jgi:glycosyltransferase involved in cell wall biosynthesis
MLRSCRDAVRSCDLVFAHNASVVERFSDVWGRHCHQFSRSFVTDATVLSQADIDARRLLLCDTTPPFRLVSAGRQIAIKGTDHALRAVAEARSRGLPVELHVIGDGEQLGSFRQLCEELKLGSAVHFEPAVPFGSALFDHWSRMHAMLLTNLTTELSRNVMLSMARGLPLITYSNPAHDPLLRSHDSAEIVPLGDVAALARAIEHAHRDRGRLLTIMDNGLKVARANTLDQTHRQRARLARLLVHPEGA